MIEGSLQDLIENLCEVVLNTHYSYIRDPDLREDLKQEGYIKALELIKRGNYAPNHNLRTYLYTGIRNEMRNFLYRDNRDSWYEIDLNCCGSYQMETTFYELDYDLIYRICNKYRLYGDYRLLVIKYFRDLGLTVHAPKLVNKIEEPIEAVLQAIIGEIIWQI